MHDLIFFIRQFLSKSKYCLLGKIPYTNIHSQIEKIRELKGAYCGKRCFFVGSGPSLDASDLDLLKDEITFAVNRIFYIFDKTDWRPTFYLNQEINFKEGDRLINELNGAKFNNQTTFFFPFSGLKKHISFENSIFLPIYMDFCEYNLLPVRNFSLDCSKKIVHAYTSMYTVLQIAVYLGFSEIYLIGFDGSYSPGKSHFYEDPLNDSNFYNPHKSKYLSDNINRGFRGMKYAQVSLNSFRIINLTRGGDLSIFPRDELENVLSLKNKVDDV